LPKKHTPPAPENLATEEPNLPGVNRAADKVEPEKSPPFPIVAIGGSAGGLEAFKQLLGSLPSDTGMAFVFLLHMPKDHQSVLWQVLARETKMKVVEAAEGAPIEPDHVYVMPAGAAFVVSSNHFRTSVREAASSRPIDHFMRSLAEEHMHKSIGVVLSGMANDGTRGIEEIKGAGGITFAQDDTAQYISMPRSAVATGAIDFVLPPEEIGRELGRIAGHPYVAHAATLVPEDAFESIVEVLHEATGVDFSSYKRNTLHRRITRRMVLHKCTNSREYRALLASNPGEVGALYQDVLIGVTSFFRNPEAYEALKATVFKRLAGNRSRNDPVRIWALGCSTGEEAYSLAMDFVEFSEETGQHLTLQVFATDLNAAGVEKARAGIYPKGIAQDVSPERLRRFFVEVDGSYRICKPIRDMCVFARQNVLADPPFSRMDLVACRNLLIYMEPVLQQRVIPLLHYALRSDGFLWLGSSETIGSYRELFDLLDPKHKIYAKKAAVHVPVSVPPHRSLVPVATAVAGARPPGRDPVPGLEAQREADRIVIARYGPPGVVLDANHEIIQFRGDTSPYLSPAPGKASLNLLKMLREGLMVAVRDAIARAKKEGLPVREEGLRVRSNGGWRDVDIAVVPIRGAEPAGASVLVLFEETAGHITARLRQREIDAEFREANDPARDADAVERENARLKQELAATRDYLQSVIEQQEAANEELQSANEEVQSANEELQSINEELETSKEEIQSANEELATVNDELQDRNQELSQSNNDLTNLLSSVQLAIVMLGADQRIRRFTPSAEKLLNLIAADVGRPLADIKLRLQVDDLEAMVTEVIDTVTPRQVEVQDDKGRWYSLRIRPYRTLENRIEGAVIVFVDIDDLKRAENTLREGDRAKDNFLAMLAHELRNPLAGIRGASRLLATSKEEDVLAEACRIVERQTTQMVRMVDELLDVARMTHGKIGVRSEPVNLVEVVRHVVAATASEREQFGHAFEAEIPDAPAWVKGDPMRLDQVFTNLLNNAAKFTGRGGSIAVSVRLARVTPDHPGEVEVRVRDNGRGIDPALLPHVFELFVQGERAPTRGGTGMGLGLTLARQIVNLHHGTIEARSAGTGKGSEFVVRLPLISAVELPPAPHGRERRAQATVPKRVLIVDDNQDAAAALRMILEAAGHQARVVHDGGSALPASTGFRPDVILLDLGLPDIDGLEVAKRLRNHESAVKATLVAVTGYGRPDDMRLSREAGIDEHLTKPIDNDVLLDIVDQARSVA
jgi:two-component system CheB/CheR fusion protein